MCKIVWSKVYCLNQAAHPLGNGMPPWQPGTGARMNRIMVPVMSIQRKAAWSAGP